MPRAFTIVGLGESLFDVFPDRIILGGAPLNVAYHAHQLCSAGGGRGVVASGVGVDDLGHRLLRELVQHGLSTEFVQVDSEHPTGRVDITLRDGEPTYTFLDNTAWDHLAWTPAWEQLASACDAVVFGTLAQRSAISQVTIQRFLEHAPQAVRLFDVNLRVTFFDTQSLRLGAERATAIKLNEEELPIVLRLLGLSDEPPDDRCLGDETSGAVRRLLATFALSGLRQVVVTHGERGTELFTLAGAVRGTVDQFPRQPLADNVGAGDACSAGLLWGWLNDWPPARTVALANRLGAYVASQPGATPVVPREVREST